MDTQKAGPTITASLPVLNKMENASSGFLGVAGVDITFRDLRKLLPNSDQFYGFLIDNNGIVMYHPRLRTPVSTSVFADCPI